MPPPQHSHEHSVPLPQPPQAPTPARNASRLLPVLGVVTGLLGLLLGAAAWFRADQADASAPTVYSEQQVAEATKSLCDAYVKGMGAIRTVGSVKVDPSDWFPTAINTRLAGFAVGTYFLDSINENPGSPDELKNLLRQAGEAYRNIALSQLTDGQPSDYSVNNETLESVVPRIAQTCQ